MKKKKSRWKQRAIVSCTTRMFLMSSPWCSGLSVGTVLIDCKRSVSRIRFPELNTDSTGAWVRMIVVCIQNTIPIMLTSSRRKVQMRSDISSHHVECENTRHLSSSCLDWTFFCLSISWNIDTDVALFSWGMCTHSFYLYFYTCVASLYKYAVIILTSIVLPFID